MPKKKEEPVIEVLLTERQIEIFELWKTGEYTQEDIALKLYGDKYRQGDVSRNLKMVSKRLGIDIIAKFKKPKKNPDGTPVKYKLYRYKPFSDWGGKDPRAPEFEFKDLP